MVMATMGHIGCGRLLIVVTGIRDDMKRLISRMS